MLDVIESVSKNNKENSNFKFMWLNTEINGEFASLFGVSEYPKIVIFSAGKRNKFLVNDGPIEASQLRKILSRNLLKLVS